MSGPSFAQSAPSPTAKAPPPADTGTRNDDIVVTARRVEERLQDVPISITVFNQAQITNRNIISAGDLATYTPSLSANSRFGSENTSFSIRGFTQDNGTAPSVAVYFADVGALRAAGGVTLGNGAGPGALFDLQNVQVLKGPQGTLFGRNTTGGAVLLVPQKPTSRFEGYVEGTYGNYDTTRIQAVTNVPVTDGLRIRVGVDHQSRDGYLRNRSGIGPDRYSDLNYTALRVSAVADLTPNLENYFIGTYSDSDTNGYLPQVFTCYTGTGRPEAQLGCNQVARRAERGYGFHDVENAAPLSRQHVRQWQLIDTLTWRASDSLTVKNIVSYGQFREQFVSSPYGENLILTSGPNAGRSFSRVLTSNFPGRDNSAQSTFTEELQFQGDGFDNRLKWQAGGYLEISDPLGFSGALTPAYALCPTPTILSCQSSGLTAAGRPVAASAAGRSYETYYRDHGLYGQATYDLARRLSVTGGFRYTWSRTRQIGRHINYSPLPITTAVPLGTCLDALTFGRPGTGTNVNRTEDQCQASFTQKSARPTWLIDLDYKPLDDVLLYAKYSRGYRQGGVKSDASGLERFGPEKLDAYEVGFKASLRGPVRGSLNVAAFYNDLADQQLAASAQPLPGNPNPTAAQVIVNAGTSRIKGVEVEASISPFRGFTVDASYAYLDTKLRSINAISSSPIYAAPVISTGRLDYPLALTPKNKVTVTGTYVLPLAKSVGEVSVGATFTHTDRSYSTFQDTVLLPVLGTDLGIVPATDLLNLNVNWTSVAKLPVDLSFFMTNVTNQKYATAVFGGLTSFGFEARSLSEPRFFGVRLRYRFRD